MPGEIVSGVAAFNALVKPIGEAAGTIGLLGGTFLALGHYAQKSLTPPVDDEQVGWRTWVEGRIRHAETIINDRHLSTGRADELRFFLVASKRKVNTNKNLQEQTASWGGTMMFNCNPGSDDASSRVQALKDEYTELNRMIKEAQHEIEFNRHEESQRNMREEPPNLVPNHPFGFVPAER